MGLNNVGDEMAEVVWLKGPVELVGGQLMLRIPLQAGGAALAESARGISKVDSESLSVSIPDWLAEKLGICEGTIVVVDNHDGKFNIVLAGHEHQ